MDILILSHDDIIRRNFPLGFRKYFPEATIETAYDLKSAQNALNKKIYGVIMVDSQMKDITEKVSDDLYLAEIIWTVLSSPSKLGKVAILTHRQVEVESIFPWGITRCLNKKDIFISPMAVNQITPDLTVEPMSYQYSF